MSPALIPISYPPTRLHQNPELVVSTIEKSLILNLFSIRPVLRSLLQEVLAIAGLLRFCRKNSPSSLKPIFGAQHRILKKINLVAMRVG